MKKVKKIVKHKQLVLDPPRRHSVDDVTVLVTKICSIAGFDVQGSVNQGLFATKIDLFLMPSEGSKTKRKNKV